jgi:biofilm PGA synthesis N-glycosyltransferase PgaC
MLPPYALITPARNEADFIELTLKSVVAQIVRPVRWVIVSDGSTDGTDEIVSKYASDHPWIQLVRMPERKERHFSGKVGAFNAGYGRLHDVDYEVVCSLDGDLSFGENYFSFLLGKLEANPSLGLVGTPFREGAMDYYDYRFVNIEHVSGACQMFRRRCFEDIGGYVAVKGGGIDYIAVTTARMKGWKTRTFTEEFCFHHRPMGTAQHKQLAAKFKIGVKDYALGNHPVWELSRTMYQLTQKPRILGGVMVLSGYIWAFGRRAKRPVSPELMRFIRREQMQRLTSFVTRSKPPRKPALELPQKSG